MTKILSLFSALALVAAWILPNHYYPWASAYNEFAAFFAALLLSLVLLRQKIMLNRSTALFILLAAIPLIQYKAGIIFFWGDALIASLYVAGFAVMILVGYNLARTSQKNQQLSSIMAYVFLAGSLISILLALKQWLVIANSFWIADMPPDGRPFANLAQPNMLATLLCMGLAGVIYLFEIRKIQAFTASLATMLLLFGVALTQSRTPWVGAIFAIIWWAWKARALKPRLSLKMIFGWLALYAVYMISIPKISVLLGIGYSDLQQHSMALERLTIWHQMITAILNGPLWGYGWNQVSVAQFTVSNLVPAVGMFEHSHNILLDFLVWNGPLLGIIFILAISVWLIKMAWHVRSIESIFGLMAIGFLLIHGMLEFPLDYAYFLLPAGLILGMAEADQLPTRTLVLPRPIYAIVIAGAFAMFAIIWQEYRLIDEDSRLLRFEMGRIGTLKAKQPAPDVSQLTQLREYTRFSRIPPTSHMSAAELERTREVAYRFPFVFALYRYNLALAINHQPNTKTELERTKGLYGPKNYEQIVAKIAAHSDGKDK